SIQSASASGVPPCWETRIIRYWPAGNGIVQRKPACRSHSRLRTFRVGCEPRSANTSFSDRGLARLGKYTFDAPSVTPTSGAARLGIEEAAGPEFGTCQSAAG